MYKGHFPAKRTRLLVPVRKNGKDSLVDGLVIAILLHVVGMYWADCVVSSETRRNNQVKSLVIGVLFSLDEVLDKRKTALPKLKVVARVINAALCEVFDKRGSRC